MKIGIVGSRNLKKCNIEGYIPKEVTEIVSGGAMGIDRCAREYAMPSESRTLHGLKCPFRPELQAVRSKYDNIPSLTPLVQNKNFYFKLPRSR